MAATQWVSTGLKPLSANQMHLGRKTDSAAYRKYKAELMRRLPDLEIPEGPLRLRVLACFSSKLADLDNILKPLQDILQARYGFNDRDIFRIVAQKKIVKKGEETLVFSITPWHPEPEEQLDESAESVQSDRPTKTSRRRSPGLRVSGQGVRSKRPEDPEPERDSPTATS